MLQSAPGKVAQTWLPWHPSLLYIQFHFFRGFRIYQLISYQSPGISIWGKAAPQPLVISKFDQEWYHHFLEKWRRRRPLCWKGGRRVIFRVQMVSYVASFVNSVPASALAAGETPRSRGQPKTGRRRRQASGVVAGGICLGKAMSSASFIFFEHMVEHLFIWAGERGDDRDMHQPSRPGVVCCKL